MAGLLQEQMPQQAAQAPQQGQQNAPRGQEMYTKLVTMLLEFLYSDQGVQAVKQGLQMGDPVESIGTISARLIQKTWTDAKGQGKSLPAMMVIQANMEVVEAITDMAIEAGLVPQEGANQMAKMAFYESMTILGEDTPPDLVLPEEREQFGMLLDQITQMDQQYSGGQEQPQEMPPEQMAQGGR